jgi:hypothetical protein
MYLFQHIICYFIGRCHRIKVGCMGPHLCNEYIKGLDAFIDFVKKDMLDNVRGNLVVLANIARMRRNIMQIMC